LGRDTFIGCRRPAQEVGSAGHAVSAVSKGHTVTPGCYAAWMAIAGRFWSFPIDNLLKWCPGTTPPMRRMKLVSPGYFGAIGTRMIAGRDITWSDIYGRATVARS
jgi:hypothetical protein